MPNTWPVQQYFVEHYNSWVKMFKGQHLDGVYVIDEIANIDAPDFEFNIPAESDDSDIILKLRSGRCFRVSFNSGDTMELSERGADLCETIRVEEFFSPGDNGIFVEVPIWAMLASPCDEEIIDVVPSIGADERVDGVIFIFNSGNFCVYNSGCYDSDVASPRYINRLRCREVFSAMSAWLRQFDAYDRDVGRHKSGRNKHERFVFTKLKNRSDISALLGRSKLGYSNNLLPSHNETSTLLCEAALIVDLYTSPEIIFDTLNWFCRKCCTAGADCTACPIADKCGIGINIINKTKEGENK